MWAAAKRTARFAITAKWQLATLKWRLILLGIAALVLFLVILVVGVLVFRRLEPRILKEA